MLVPSPPFPFSNGGIAFHASAVVLMWALVIDLRACGVLCGGGVFSFEDPGTGPLLSTTQIVAMISGCYSVSKCKSVSTSIFAAKLSSFGRGHAV